MSNWKIHCVAGEKLLPGMVDAHTHGLNKYNHLELQFVLAYPTKYIGAILNEIGKKISKGKKLKEGELIRVSVLSCDLKVVKTTDAFDEPIFRIIIPDEKYKWPEDSEEYPYNMQLKSPYEK